MKKELLKKLTWIAICMLIAFQVGCSPAVQVDNHLIDNMSREEALSNLVQYSTKTPYAGKSCEFSDDSVGSNGYQHMRPYPEYNVSTAGTVVQLIHRDIWSPTAMNTESWCQLQNPPLNGGDKAIAKLLTESAIVLGASYKH